MTETTNLIHQTLDAIKAKRAEVAAKAAEAAKLAATHEARKAMSQAERDAERAAKRLEREAKKIAEKEAKAAEKQAKKDAKKAEREAEKQAKKSDVLRQNDVRMPREGTVNHTVWMLLDSLSEAQGAPVAIGDAILASEILQVEPKLIRSVYAQWRKFHGITGRIASQAALAKQEAFKAVQASLETAETQN